MRKRILILTAMLCLAFFGLAAGAETFSPSAMARFCSTTTVRVTTTVVSTFTTTVTQTVTTTVTTTTTPTTTTNPPPPGEPAPIAGQGYHQVFRDDFNTLDRSVWDDHIWYEGSPNWANAQSVSGGVLHLLTTRANGYQNNTVTTQSSGKTWTLGYFEASMKWTGGRGTWPGFWLFSYRHATNPAWPSINPYCANNGLPNAQCYSAELDAFEGQGSEPHSFYGTIHRNSSNDYGVNDTQNSNNWKSVTADLTTGFHTYGMLWTSTQISWYLDGSLLMSAPVYDSTNQPMFLLLQMWTGGWTFGTDSTTPASIQTDVDYVQVWQK